MKQAIDIIKIFLIITSIALILELLDFDLELKAGLMLIVLMLLLDKKNIS